jgi:hypothetical protein
VDLLVIILRSPEVPTLSRPQLQRCFKASRAYKAYKSAQAEMEDSDDDLGPEDDDAWLFEDLNLLLKLWTKRREKEGLLALIFEVGHDIVAASTLLTNRVLLQNCSRTSSQSSTLLLLRCIRRLVLPTLWVIYRIS